MDHPCISEADLCAGGGQHLSGKPLLLPDRAGGQVYGQADGTGLHFREDHDAEQGGQKRGRPLLHLYGLPQLPHPLCGPPDRQGQVLRQV